MRRARCRARLPLGAGCPEVRRPAGRGAERLRRRAGVWGRGRRGRDRFRDVAPRWTAIQTSAPRPRRAHAPSGGARGPADPLPPCATTPTASCTILARSQLRHHAVGGGCRAPGKWTGTLDFPLSVAGRYRHWGRVVPPGWRVNGPLRLERCPAAGVVRMSKGQGCRQLREVSPFVAKHGHKICSPHRVLAAVPGNSVRYVRTQTLKQVRDRTCRREFPGDTKRLWSGGLWPGERPGETSRNEAGISKQETDRASGGKQKAMKRGTAHGKEPMVRHPTPLSGGGPQPGMSAIP